MLSQEIALPLRSPYLPPLRSTSKQVNKSSILKKKKNFSSKNQISSAKKVSEGLRSSKSNKINDKEPLGTPNKHPKIKSNLLQVEKKPRIRKSSSGDANSSADDQTSYNELKKSYDSVTAENALLKAQIKKFSVESAKKIKEINQLNMDIKSLSQFKEKHAMLENRLKDFDLMHKREMMSLKKEIQYLKDELSRSRRGSLTNSQTLVRSKSAIDQNSARSAKAKYLTLPNSDSLNQPRRSIDSGTSRNRSKSLSRPVSNSDSNSTNNSILKTRKRVEAVNKSSENLTVTTNEEKLSGKRMSSQSSNKNISNKNVAKRMPAIKPSLPNAKLNAKLTAKDKKDANMGGILTSYNTNEVLRQIKQNKIIGINEDTSLTKVRSIPDAKFKDRNEAVGAIQAAVRGHLTRYVRSQFTPPKSRKSEVSPFTSEISKEKEKNVTLIQSAIRSYLSNVNYAN